MTTPKEYNKLIKTILIIGNTFAVDQIAKIINKYNDGNIEIKKIDYISQLQLFSADSLKGARLISCCSTYIVPPDILSALGFGAYNFHPGPPEYPGWAPFCFASYHGATSFGATAHLMTEKVDAGPIIGVESFAVTPATSAEELTFQTFNALLRLFESLAERLLQDPTPLPSLPVAWGPKRTTKKQFAQFCALPPDIKGEEMIRRVRAFGIGDGLCRPSLQWGGERYVLAEADGEEDNRQGEETITLHSIRFTKVKKS